MDEDYFADDAALSAVSGLDEDCTPDQLGNGSPVPAETRVINWKYWIYLALVLYTIPLLLDTPVARYNHLVATGLCAGLTGICYISFLILDIRRILKRYKGRLFDLPEAVRRKCRYHALYLWFSTQWPTAACLYFFIVKHTDYLYPAFFLLVTFWFLVDLLLGLVIARELIYSPSMESSCLRFVLIGSFVTITANGCLFACLNYNMHEEADLRLMGQIDDLMQELNSPTTLEEHMIGEECGTEMVFFNMRRQRLLNKLCRAYLIGCAIMCLPIGYLLIRRP